MATSPAFTIPNSPALGGQTFYDQALFLDAAANAWGVVPVGAMKWRIGTNRGAPGAMLQYSGSNSAAVPAGNTAGHVISIRLQ